MNLPNDSIYDKIGLGGLARVVWRSTPWTTKIASFPYGLCVYYRMLHDTGDLSELFGQHTARYSDSRAFRVLRPSYRKARKLLRQYGIPEVAPDIAGTNETGS